MNDTPTPPAIPSTATKRARKGFLDPKKVRATAFYIITLCIIVSVGACILAIWDFAQKDALWRTMATCVVVAAACGVFSVVNVVFGAEQE